MTATTSDTAETPDGSKQPFATMRNYVAIPRLTGLALSPDGRRLVTSVSELNHDGTKWVSSVWEIDPAGQRAPHKLTRGAASESAPAFAPDGTLLFTSARQDPESPDADSPEPPLAALWALPAGSGEARAVLSRPGGISAFAVARDAGDIAYRTDVLPGAKSVEQDAATRKARIDAGVTAVLHEDYPVRYWDHDLGPARPRVFHAGALAPESESETLSEGTDLTGELSGPGQGAAHLGDDLTVSPDGRFVAASRDVHDDSVASRTVLDLVNVATGERRQLVGGPDASYSSPAFTPGSHLLVCVRETLGTYDEPSDRTLWLVDVVTGEGRDLTPELDLWPGSPIWSADGAAVLFTADRCGHHPAFRLDITTGAVTQLTAAGYYSDLVAAPDGSNLCAMRAAIDCPPRPVRLDPAAVEQVPAELPAPGQVEVPGTLTDIDTIAEDGTSIRAWLVLPEGADSASPAPLLLWIHGGPTMSWNSWSWRWNPWLMATQGYAVLLPDPALSTGYGQTMVRRGWGSWGGKPYTDLLAITDAAEARPDIDATRTAAMGGSFGGYMANWVATKTDRFRCIVTHASLWNLQDMYGISDESGEWAREFGDPQLHPQRYAENSPHLGVDAIQTPMLVIHGDKDYRVPIGSALRLWYDLRRADVPAKFLYFPDENHWILTPGNATAWYETIFAFLAEHALDQPWERPRLL